MNIFTKLFGLVILLMGVAVAWRGHYLGYINYRMPAAGFFPFWGGLLLAVSGGLLLVRRVVEPPLPEDIVLSKQMIAILSVGGYVLLMQVLGTLVATIVYFVVVLYFIERHRWHVVALCTAISLSIIYGSFEMWLRIPLARGVFDTY